MVALVTVPLVTRTLMPVGQQFLDQGQCRQAFADGGAMHPNQPALGTGDTGMAQPFAGAGTDLPCRARRAGAAAAARRARPFLPAGAMRPDPAGFSSHVFQIVPVKVGIETAFGHQFRMACRIPLRRPCPGHRCGRHPPRWTRRWAMTMVVRPFISRRQRFLDLALGSRRPARWWLRPAAGSGALRSMARAMAMRWRWPPDSFRPAFARRWCHSRAAAP